MNRTTRHVIEPAGSIRRLTAAVLLDDAIEHKKVNGKWIEVRNKRQPDELKLISDLAGAAIGFNSARGDVISVQNLTFDRGAPADIEPATLADQARKGLTDYATAVRFAVLLILFLLVYLLTIRPVDLELRPARETQADLAERSALMKKQLTESVKADPERSVTAVRAWLREEGS